MWVKVRCATAAVAISALASGASAAVIADFQNDFRADTPKPGWSYLWNANGPAGIAANYVPLVPNDSLGGSYATAAGPLPHAAPGANLAITSTTIYPGQGSSQAADGIERFAVVGYTLSPADIATAGGGEAWLDTYRFAVPFVPDADGITSRIYVNDTLFIEMPLPPGLDYDSATSYGAYPVPLGNLQAGDTIYVAIGAKAWDTSDALQTNFTISLVPEPASLSLLGIMSLGLLGRRVRRSA